MTLKFNHPRKWFRPAPVDEEGAHTPNTWEGWLIVILILCGMCAFAWTMLPLGNTHPR
jgi:hypothetical protein